jgi:hypothetical protein
MLLMLPSGGRGPCWEDCGKAALLVPDMIMRNYRAALLLNIAYASTEAYILSLIVATLISRPGFPFGESFDQSS